MTGPTPCIVIVDPFSAGALLAESLRGRGARCVAVESAPHLLPSEMKRGFTPTAFEHVVEHTGDFEQTLATLRAFAPTQIVPGFESGVGLASQLSTALSLSFGHPQPALLAARRDKYQLAQVVQAHGIRAPLQHQSADIDSLVAWARTTGRWPVIAKPLASLASDMVTLCRNTDELKHAAARILASTNVIGRVNAAVLIQEFVEGTEYAVDVVSVQGQRKLTAVWEYRRPPDATQFVCYDAMVLLPYTGPRQSSLRDFAFGVCDALELDFGPAHCEVMWVDGEPVLVELGARLNGGSNAVLSGLCGGFSQVDETTEAILNPQRFLATVNSRPTLKKHAANVFLHPPHSGRLKRTHGLDELTRLTTFHSMSVTRCPGDLVGRVAGRITLLHETIPALDRDIALIRQLLHRGMFEIEAE